MRKLLLSFLVVSACGVPSFGSEVKVENGVVSPIPNSESRRNYRTLSNQSEVIEKALNYLNHLRALTGLRKFCLNSLLSQAAYNHAKYMAVNRIIGHYENEGYSGFTGVTPSDRVLYVGYPSRFVGENLSYGQKDVCESIDSLFSAIYHRFGFLNYKYDEIGIGIYDTFYVYDMGNRELSQYCENPESEINGYYYYDMCADRNTKVPADIFDSLLNSQPDYVLWPPPKFSDTPPAFYEESPDPLPDYSVSGYPISINFNPIRFSDVELESFRLYRLKNGQETEITDTRVLTHETDPNGHLSPLEFALFPLERLDWGSDYIAEAVVSVNGTERLFRWEFKTKNLTYPYYVVDEESATIPVKSGVTYELYLIPLSPDDVIESYRYSGYWDKADFGFTDSNTIHFRIDGKVGNTVTLEVKEKDRTRIIKLVISEKDEAIYPESEKEEVVLILKKGWNLKGTLDNISLKNFEIPEVSIIWKYKNGNWYGWSPDDRIMELISKAGIESFDRIDSGDGFWVKVTHDVEIELSGGGK